MEPRTPLLIIQPDDVKWGWIRMYVVCSEREFRYWQKRQQERSDEIDDTGDQRKIDEWRTGQAANFDCARRIRQQLTDRGWIAPETRDDDYPQA